MYQFGTGPFSHKNNNMHTLKSANTWVEETCITENWTTLPETSYFRDKVPTPFCHNPLAEGNVEKQELEMMWVLQELTILQTNKSVSIPWQHLY